ncbi:MAG: hypothetical protein COX80_01650 [Candidatus Magasanikbacteria bacterium CG_4_10_14_0_2_um_filter_33_14]|uniref:Hydrolase TatD n=1 Tax=Candidatus Magasanikbacteria bacterium CG_4_10_14_0_2_um_filter_33_14 TaxID=1974636 RepID=A0A2M7VB79_9BACT|nr:MAG: hypothetical protein COX80_01650 [Candidatus Magasanikbacteria bacterium CG_4_10_14_0_2_um_filter_33_14]
MIFDSHCHIQFKGFDEEREDVLKICAEKNIWLHAIGTQKDTSKKAVELAESHDNIFASIGIHPIHLFPTYVDEEESSFVSREESFDEEYFDELAKSPKVIAVGECGFELYHVPKDKTVEEVLAKQKEIFLAQYHFAQKHNLPLVIHVRDAHDQLIEVLKELPKPIRGVIHCFSGDWSVASKYLDFGLNLGFTGIITFPIKKTAPQIQEDLWEVVQKVPNDRFIVETDAPYLAPQKYRGKRCEPWMVEEVADKVAELKGLSIDEVKKLALENSLRVFDRMKII